MPFSTAKSLAPRTTAAAKKPKACHEIHGLQDIAILDAVIKQATALKESLETKAKDAGFEIFMELKGSTRPSSFEGVDGKATASVEMRKRSTNSKLNEDEIEVLEAAGYQPFKQVVTHGLFAINPDYAADDALLGRVEKALAKIVPEDFIVRQEEVSKFVVSDEMLDTAFSNAKTPNAVLKIMTCMALKLKLSESYEMENLLRDVSSIMHEVPKMSEVQPLDTPAPAKKTMSFGKAAKKVA
jgi:hypothetical protein